MSQNLVSCICDEDAEDVKSYRPISNLMYTCQSSLRGWSTDRSRPIWKQIIFFQNSRHSTETAVLKVLSDIFTATDQGSIGLLGLLDMSAAFDTVDHEILLLRLESSFGISGTALAYGCVRSYLVGLNKSSSMVANHYSTLSLLAFLRVVCSGRSCFSCTPRIFL